MLSLLQIRNFAIVESLDLELADGFTAITGETGAGKSIMVDALMLLLGGRGDSTAIRAGSERAELTAEFDLAGNDEAREWMREAGLDGQDACLLRRVIADNGRSRAWINGTAATLTQLQELGRHLVEIHGQNEHIRLMHAGEQFRLLDSAAQAGTGLAAALCAVAQRYAAWKEVDQAMQALRSESAASPGDLELLQFQIQELEQDALGAEALDALEAEHRMLARGTDILAALQGALDQLEADDTGIVHGLHDAHSRLESFAALDPEVGSAARALAEAAINCEEARSSLQAALSRIDLSPQRLAELDAKLARLQDLARKHRVTARQLVEVLADLQGRAEGALSLDERRRKLTLELDQRLKAYREASQELSRARQTRALALGSDVTDLMQVLGMAGGRFEIRVTPVPDAPPSVRGDDRLEFLVSANPGIPPGPLRKVASGGELSRISLALKVAASAGQTAPTQIFDEVDAGIGGATADAVGQLLKRVSYAPLTGADDSADHSADDSGRPQPGQALCVTHLAQVAVCADHQFRVIKRTGTDSTSVDVARLQPEQRVDEIARMLGGRLTEQSRAHARELLGSTRQAPS